LRIAPGLGATAKGFICAEPMSKFDLTAAQGAGALRKGPNAPYKQAINQ
jgi:hypothetical protein